MLENFDYKNYRELLEMAKEDKIYIVHTFDKSYHKGGFTIAWQRDGDGINNRMINVAISYCSPEDYFCRRIGTLNALTNAYSDRYIKVPVNSPNSDEVVEQLRMMFDV